MDKFEKYKQTIIKFSIPIALLIFAIFIVFTVSDDVKNKKNKNEVILFTEEEMVKTRYMDEISKDILQTKEENKKIIEENKKLKEEMEIIKNMLKEQRFNKKNAKEKNLQTNETLSNYLKNNLYNNFPPPVSVENKKKKKRDLKF